MARHIHFELFVRRGASPGWVLLDAIANRDEALKAAAAELAAGRCAAARIVKEIYDDGAGDFQSVRIFEEGTPHKVKASKKDDDDAPVLPCLTPDDLYSAHARATLSKLFADPLARWKLTVTELIHRADALERLEATGTLFQHAVQKIAVAQAAGPTGQPVVATIRALNDLADRAINRVYREDRAKRIPACETPAALAACAFARAEDGRFAVGLAFAAYLAPATGWTAKLDRILAVLADPPPEGPARDIVLGLADDIAAEILAGSAALTELIGPMPDLGHALIAMSDLYLGRVPAGGADSCLGRLGAQFSGGRLLGARTALARRVVAELRAHKKLAPEIEAEMVHLRAIASRLVLGPPRLMPHDDIVAAVTVRSRRLVNPDVIASYLKSAAGAVERAEQLIALEENIVGAENKRRIWDQLKPTLASPAFEAELLDSRLPPLARVARAADFQARLARTSFADNAQSEAVAMLDAYGRRILDPARLAAACDHAERGDAMLLGLVRALLARSIPEGDCEAVVRAALRRKLADGALLRVLAADAAAAGDASPAAVRETLTRLALAKAAAA